MTAKKIDLLKVLKIYWFWYEVRDYYHRRFVDFKFLIVDHKNIVQFRDFVHDWNYYMELNRQLFSH